MLILITNKETTAMWHDLSDMVIYYQKMTEPWKGC